MSEIILISASSFRRFLVILITSFALSTCAAQDAARVEMFYKGLRFYLFDNFVPANDTFTALSDSLVGSPTPSFLKARIASRSNDFATAQLLFSDASKMDRKNPSVALYANINEIYYHYTPDLDKHVCASAVHLGAFLQYLQAYQRIGKLSNLLDCIQSSEYLFYNSSLFKYYLLSLLQRGDSVEYRSRLVESTCFVPYEYDSLLSLLPVPIHST
ncbi:MAG: hypothetical protein RIS47_2139, partial [Bacteroidota bacterium]